MKISSFRSESSYHALAAATIASHSTKPLNRLASTASSLVFLLFLGLLAVLPQLALAQDATSQIRQMGNQGLSWLWMVAYIGLIAAIIITGLMASFGHAQWATFFKVLAGGVLIGAAVAIAQAFMGSATNTSFL